MTCLLLLGSMAPTTALCTGKDASKRGKEKGCDRPYSEAMYVKRQGGDLYISAKLDERTDITYWFRRCMFNELYTFYRVGITRNRTALPTTQPEAEPAVLLNSTYSDNIGPFAIPGCGWCGGNHKYRERTARTARSEGYTLLADGNRIEGDTTLWANRVTVEAENVILDPTRPYRNAAGGEELRDTLCRESVTYTVRRNNIEVTASHRFCNAAPVTIAIYYGMQSMFEGETHVLTPGGAYTDWTEVAKASTFTKQEHPLFRRYVEKNRQGYQSTWLLPDGLGDHALLDGQDALRQELPQAHRKQTDGERRQDLLAGCLHLVRDAYRRRCRPVVLRRQRRGTYGRVHRLQAGLQEDAGTARIPRPAAFRNGRTEQRHPYFGRRAE